MTISTRKLFAEAAAKGGWFGGSPADSMTPSVIFTRNDDIFYVRFSPNGAKLKFAEGTVDGAYVMIEGENVKDRTIELLSTLGDPQVEIDHLMERCARVTGNAGAETILPRLHTRLRKAQARLAARA